jgi:hypothetical protein
MGSDILSTTLLTCTVLVSSLKQATIGHFLRLVQYRQQLLGPLSQDHAALPRPRDEFCTWS